MTHTLQENSQLFFPLMIVNIHWVTLNKNIDRQESDALTQLDLK